MPATSKHLASPAEKRSRNQEQVNFFPVLIGKTDQKFSRIFVFLLGLLITLIPLLLRSRAALISPYDELYHLSYIQYAYEWRIPRPGNPLNTWSREIFDCFPVHPWGAVTGNECGNPGPISSYPEGGGSTAANWPPIYYFTIAILLRPLSLFFSSPLFAARFAGVLIWSIGTQCLVTQTSRISNAQSNLLTSGKRTTGDWKVRLTISMLFGVLPLAYHHASFVSPYSFAPLAAAIALAAIRKIRSHLTLATVSSTVALILPHALPIILAAASTSVALGRSTHRSALANRRNGLSFRTLDRYSRQLVFCGAFALAYKGWTFLQFSLRASRWDPGINQAAMTQYGDLSFNVGTARSRLWSFIPEGIWTHQFQDQLEYFFSYSWGLIALVCLGIALNTSSNNKLFGASIVIFGTGYSIFLATQLDYNIPSRYGIMVVVTWISFALNHVGHRFQVVLFIAAAATYIQLFSHYPLSVG